MSQFHPENLLPAERTTVGLLDIPDELIVSICETMALSNDNGWAAAAELATTFVPVCRRTRSVALGVTHLWTYIPYMGSSLQEDTAVERHPSVQHALHQALRARAFPLHLRWSDSSTMFEILRALCDRLASVHLSLDCPLLQEIGQLAFPVLRSASFRVDECTMTSHPSTVFPSQMLRRSSHLSRLHVLTMGTLGMWNAPVLAFSLAPDAQLQDVSFGSDEPWPLPFDIDPIFDQSSASLVHLRLDVDPYWISPPSPRNVTAPQLEHLTVVGPSCLRLRGLRAPRLRFLTCFRSEHSLVPGIRQMWELSDGLPKLQQITLDDICWIAQCTDVFVQCIDRLPQLHALVVRDPFLCASSISPSNAIVRCLARQPAMIRSLQRLDVHFDMLPPDLDDLRTLQSSRPSMVLTACWSRDVIRWVDGRRRPCSVIETL